MTRKNIEKKQALVEELKDKINEANSIVIVDYLGLSVEEVTKLRVELMKNGCEFKVIKNNIIRRAAEAAGYEELTESTTGPNAIAFSYEDSVSAAKVIHEFAKEHKKPELKVGIVDKEFMNNEMIKKIATIPSREELLTMFAGGLIEPIRKVATAIHMHAENLEKEEDNG